MTDIELVIKIPESQYKTLHAKTQADVVDVIDDKLLIDAIKNGVPLPKGHGRLIDADAYISEINRIFPCKDRDDKNIRRATEIGMTNAPTIIEADKETEND